MDNQPQIVASPQPPPQKSRLPFILMTILIAIVAFDLGVIFMMFLTPKNTQSIKTVSLTDTGKIMLPATAVRIQACADHQGALYVEPQNIPTGPVYMVNGGEVIGIEYMLAQSEFLAGKSYSNLSGLGTKVNHTNVGFLSTGHEGYAVPHYHIFLYAVSQDIEQNIICPKSNVATPAAYPTQ